MDQILQFLTFIIVSLFACLGAYNLGCRKGKKQLPGNRKSSIKEQPVKEEVAKLAGQLIRLSRNCYGADKEEISVHVYECADKSILFAVKDEITKDSLMSFDIIEEKIKI